MLSTTMINAMNTQLLIKAAKQGKQLTVGFESKRVASVNGEEPRHLSKQEREELYKIILSNSGQVLKHRIRTESPDVTFYLHDGVIVGNSLSFSILGEKSRATYGKAIPKERRR